MNKSGFKLLTTQNTEEWNSYLNRFSPSKKDVFSKPEYYKLFENKSKKAFCFIYESGKNLAIYPFLKTDLSQLNLLNFKKKYYDIEGAYGYNGAFISTFSKIFIKKFNRIFNDYCINNNIVAEFTRFNPIYNNQKFSLYFNIKKVNKNIIVDLRKDWKILWEKDFDHSIRKNYKKSLNNNLKIIHTHSNKIKKEQLDFFFDIYKKTLIRKKAKNFYFFKNKFFKDISLYLNKFAIFFFVLYKEKIISTELVLHNGCNAYSFLGGTLKSFYNLSPNDFLKVEIIKFLKKNQFKKFCLGGGLKENDGIFNFKKKYNKNEEFDFLIGTKIYNHDLYKKLSNSWIKNNPEKLKISSNFFLKYKL